VQIVNVSCTGGSDAVAGVGETKGDATNAQRSRQANFFTDFLLSPNWIYCWKQKSISSTSVLHLIVSNFLNGNSTRNISKLNVGLVPNLKNPYQVLILGGKLVDSSL